MFVQKKDSIFWRKFSIEIIYPLLVQIIVSHLSAHEHALYIYLEAMYMSLWMHR